MVTQEIRCVEGRSDLRLHALQGKTRMFGKQKNASSQAFQDAYQKLWQNGPKVKYQNPDGQVRDLAILSFY